MAKQETVKRIRLNEDMRHTLRRAAYALELERSPEYEQALTAFEVELEKALAEKYPPADLDVLERHGFIHSSRRFGITIGDRCTGPTWHIGTRKNYRCASRYSSDTLYLETEPGSPLAKAAEAAKLVQDAVHDLDQRMRFDYECLVNDSRFVDEVVAVWPDAEKILAEYIQAASKPKNTAISRLNPDLLARLASYKLEGQA